MQEQGCTVPKHLDHWTASSSTFFDLVVPDMMLVILCAATVPLQVR